VTRHDKISQPPPVPSPLTPGTLEHDGVRVQVRLLGQREGAQGVSVELSVGERHGQRAVLDAASPAQLQRLLDFAIPAFVDALRLRRGSP
jgi:hypothetical protein